MDEISILIHAGFHVEQGKQVQKYDFGEDNEEPNANKEKMTLCSSYPFSFFLLITNHVH
jgi:hypothetical protein